MSIRLLTLILMYLYGASTLYSQHNHDLQSTAKPRIIFSTASYESLDFVGASDEGIEQCSTTVSAIDVWESVSLDLGVDTIWLDVAVQKNDDSLSIGLQVYDQFDSVVFCKDNMLPGIATSFQILNNASYSMRWYRIDSSSSAGHFETTFSHPNGIVKCPTFTNFSSQKDLDEFAVNFPHCDELASGQLKISGDIDDLSPLEQVHAVNGPIVISLATNLTDLQGLHNVTKCEGLALAWNLNLTSIEALSSLEIIDGTFNIIWNPSLVHTTLPALDSIKKSVFIDGNDALENLAFLSTISSLPSGLTIQNNQALTSLDGAESITAIGGDLYIQDNPQLANCDALQGLQTIEGKLNITRLNHYTDLGFLSGLTYVGGQMTLSSNPSLINLSGLNQLREIDGGLFITDNPQLLSLQGVPALQLVDGPLRIAGNSELGHLSGLANLREIDGFLDISENESLQSLVGLESLDPTSIKSITWNFRDLTVINNPNLSICHSPAICEAIDLPNLTVSIGGNAPGCLSRIEVETFCSQPVLPVEGWEVYATAFEEGVKISWTVEQEINCASYTVMRRIGNDEWSELYYTECGDEDTYLYYDDMVGQGWVEYQVVQQDYDGQTTASSILPVHTGDMHGVQPYPNPVIDELYLGEETAYTLYNSVGHTMIQGQGRRINVTTLPAGIYFLRFGHEVHTIVKQ